VSASTEIIAIPGGNAWEIPMSISSKLSKATTEAGRLQRAALACLYDHHDAGEIPTGGRFLFYELEQAGIVSKGKINTATGEKVKRPDAPLVKALTHLRQHQIIPWAWITDESRNLVRWEYADSVADYLARAVHRSRIDAWGGSAPPLIICESKATAGVLTGLVSDYLCPIAPTGGQCGGFLHTDIAPLLLEKPTIVLYLGDYDLAGGHIESNTRRVLESATAMDIPWARVAITKAQIEERGLEPIQKKDKRFNDGNPHEAWEVEALGQATVKQLLRDELDSIIPEPLETVRARERQEQDVEADRLGGGR
jgi:hypothetical protein